MEQQSLSFINLVTNDRVRLDGVLKAIKELPSSRGASMAYTNLETGRMWLGEVCRELGKEYPYEKTKEATDAKGIQAAVDKARRALRFDGTEVQRLNLIREYLDNIINSYVDEIFDRDLTCKDVKDDFRFNVALVNAYTGLKQARMALGLRLGELRDIEYKK